MSARYRSSARVSVFRHRSTVRFRLSPLAVSAPPAFGVLPWGGVKKRFWRYLLVRFRSRGIREVKRPPASANSFTFTLPTPELAGMLRKALSRKIIRAWNKSRWDGSFSGGGLLRLKVMERARWT